MLSAFATPKAEHRTSGVNCRQRERSLPKKTNLRSEVEFRCLACSFAPDDLALAPVTQVWLAVSDDPTPAYQELAKLTEATKVQQRSYAGFNPARLDDLRLFAAVLNGDHIAQGFRNKDIRKALYKFKQDRQAIGQQSAAVDRC